MNFYKLNLFNDFKCTGSECPDNCCRDWTIYIDKKTVERYQSVDGEFGERLRKTLVCMNESGPDENYKIKLMDNGFCPFVLENGLCEVYIKLGEDAMSEVCKRYPRTDFAQATPNDRIIGLTHSCSEVCRILFSSDEKIALEKLSSGKNEPVTKDVQEKFDTLLNGLLVSMQILQNRSLSLTDRLKLTVFFNDMLEQEMKKNAPTDPLLNDFSETANHQILADNLKSYPRNNDKLTKYVLYMFHLFIRRGQFDTKFKLGDMLLDILPAVNEYNRSSGPDLFDKIGKMHYEEMDIKLERYLVCDIFRYYFLSFDNLDLVSNLTWPICLYLLNISFLAFYSDILGRTPNLDETIAVISNFARHLEYNTNTKEFMLNVIREDKLHETANLLGIIA